MGWQWLTSLFTHNQLDGRRSSALTPLLWLVLLLVVLTSVMAGARYSPQWVIQVAVILIAVVIAAFLVAYFLFAASDPDLLRSEHYSLSKMAIQHGIRGDSLSGPAGAGQPDVAPVTLDAASAGTHRALTGDTK